ncbi:MAG: protein kinase [Verrucomicrobia bacterium]|nr:protein kinase [Verrucomicrobiota bacterium]MCH8528308.1 protein kinase [Kiritimatiellia bacterium]
MLVTFHCSNCDARLRINANAMGTMLNCPECEGEIRVPKLDLGPGFVVGGFLIKHRIGQGGMGEVYLAKQLSLERDVALKILPAQYTQQSSFVVRFLKEVHYQAKMDHPNIVTAYDAGEDNGVYFMAMAHVAGETLEALLEREGCLPEAEALKIVRQVALALQYAFEQKDILHRDIKPGNIMLSPTFHAKVLDMGLSKNLLEKHSTTHADTLMGTPNYMSPEQIDHPQQIDTRSDMFSLGMTLYHTLTGKIPFEDTGYLKTLKRHAAEKLEDPRSLVPGISRHTAHLLARLLARDPADRLATWEGVLAALDRALTHTGPPISLPVGETTLALDPAHEAPPPAPARPIPDSEPSTPSLRRRVEAVPRPLGVALSVGLGLILGVAGIQGLIVFLPSPVEEVRDQDPQPDLVENAEAEASPEADPLADLRRRYSQLMLTYERNPGQFDPVLEDLLAIAREAEGTDLEERAEQQIRRIQQARSDAVEVYRRRLQDNTLRILVQQGGDAARLYLAESESPFQNAAEGLRQRLNQQIEDWELQERNQRIEDERRARERYQDLLEELVSPVLARDWAEALRLVESAVGRPGLFPLSEELASLRTELLRLQAVQGEIIQTYRGRQDQDITLLLHSGPVTGAVLHVGRDGLTLGIPILDSGGRIRGMLEELIPFHRLSSREILQRMNGWDEPHFDIYRALIHYSSGNLTEARIHLARAASDLALVLDNSLQPFLQRGGGSMYLPPNAPR